MKIQFVLTDDEEELLRLIKFHQKLTSKEDAIHHTLKLYKEQMK